MMINKKDFEELKSYLSYGDAMQIHSILGKYKNFLQYKKACSIKDKVLIGYYLQTGKIYKEDRDELEKILLGELQFKEGLNCFLSLFFGENTKGLVEFYPKMSMACGRRVDMLNLIIAEDILDYNMNGIVEKINLDIDNVKLFKFLSGWNFTKKKVENE